MNYTGAVGQFTVSADIPRPTIEVNKQGKLLVTIAGNGNFLQFSPPAITWPKGFEVFDPVVLDTINKEVAPTQGKRTYLYSFTGEKAGNYMIPPVAFSFFDPKSRRYNQLTTDSLTLVITPAKAGSIKTYGREVFGKRKALWLFILVAILVVLAASLLWRKYKMKYRETVSPDQRPNNLERLDALHSATDQEYFTQLYKLLQSISKENILTTEQKQQLTVIQQECQLLNYSQPREEDARQQLQKRTGDLLRQIAS